MARWSAQIWRVDKILQGRSWPGRDHPCADGQTPRHQTSLTPMVCRELGSTAKNKHYLTPLQRYTVAVESPAALDRSAPRIERAARRIRHHLRRCDQRYFRRRVFSDLRSRPQLVGSRLSQQLVKRAPVDDNSIFQAEPGKTSDRVAGHRQRPLRVQFPEKDRSGAVGAIGPGIVDQREKEVTMKHPNTDWLLVVHEGGPDAPISHFVITTAYA